MPTQIKLSKNANISQATHYPGNFENVFCPSPHAGKNLGRQYQGGSQAVLSEVVSFSLPADLPRIKGSLWRVEMEKELFCCLKNLQGPLKEDGTTLILYLGANQAMWGWDNWSLSLFGVSTLLLFLCDSLSQFVPISTSLFWLEPHSPVLFHQPTA